MKFSTAIASADPRRHFLSFTLAGRALAAVALLVFLSGCKIVIVMPPEGGRVVSSEGVECLAGQTCEIEVSDLNFFDTFSAVADNGYTFDQWQSGDGYLCADLDTDCVYDLRGIASNPGLLALLDSDTALYLAPEFSGSGPSTGQNRYPLGQWRQLAATLNAASYTSDAFLYLVEPDTNNCDPGSISSAATARFTEAVNLIRQLHFLPPVEYDSFWNTQMQESALVQLANETLTHTPNASDECYTAAAAAGAGSSNLSYRSLQSDPAYYPLAWVNDNRNLSAVMEAGHRRWVLDPDLGFTAYGQAEGYASMKVFGFGAAYSGTLTEDIDYIAFPFRKYPYLMVEKTFFPTPWSISMVPGPGESGAYAYFDNASVTVVNAATGSPLTVHSEHYDNRGYGLRNFFSWMVDDWEYDTLYTVTISDVQMPGGETRTIEYGVEIDYDKLQ